MDLVPTNGQDEGQSPVVSYVEIEPFSSDPKFLKEILDQPIEKIVPLIISAIATDAKGWTHIGGRLLQAAMKGIFIKQAAKEIKALIASGEIPENYAKIKYGSQTLAELLRFIDEEEVDEDRLLAVQAMFKAVNAIDAKDGERILHYQLFKISKKLSASDLLLLKVAFDLYNDSNDPNDPVELPMSYTAWALEMGQRLGHNVSSLVELTAEHLENEKLLSGRRYSDDSGIFGDNARLTELGIHFCLNIQKFQTWRKSNRRNQSGGGDAAATDGCCMRANQDSTIAKQEFLGKGDDEKIHSDF